MSDKEAKDRRNKVKRITYIANQQLVLQGKLFSSIDSKTIWLITFLVAIISMLIRFYINQLDTLLICSLILALISLGVSIFNLAPVDFEAGVNSTKITNSFWGVEKKIDELDVDVLSNLNYATTKNNETLSKKVKLFRYSLLFMVLFLTSFILFLIFFMQTSPQFDSDSDEPPVTQTENSETMTLNVNPESMSLGVNPQVEQTEKSEKKAT